MRKTGADPANAAALPYPLNRWYLQTLSLWGPGYLKPALVQQSIDIDLDKLVYSIYLQAFTFYVKCEWAPVLKMLNYLRAGPRDSGLIPLGQSRSPST